MEGCAVCTGQYVVRGPDENSSAPARSRVGIVLIGRIAWVGNFLGRDFRGSVERAMSVAVRAAGASVFAVERGG
jgi:hypothetical protein